MKCTDFASHAKPVPDATSDQGKQGLGDPTWTMKEYLRMAPPEVYQATAVATPEAKQPKSMAPPEVYQATAVAAPEAKQPKSMAPPEEMVLVQD
jgi:hypothetical protein